MRFMLRVALVPALALAIGAVWAFSAGAASAYTPMVTMIDNDGPTPNQAVDAAQSYWGYGPTQIVVKKGEQVMFVNPSSNKRNHTVTSISVAQGGAFENTLQAGTKFDSSPTRETVVAPGNSWMLDTSTVDPGNYAFYCRFHPWMVGEITVLPE